MVKSYEINLRYSTWARLGKILETKKCEVCQDIAVDVWLDPRDPGQVLWVCLEDLMDLTELFDTPRIHYLGESKEETQ